MSVETVDDIGTLYKSRTYKRRVGCENLYVIVAFSNHPKKPDKIEFIRISGKVDNECGTSFYESLADQTTFALRRARNEWEIRQIIKNLRYHRCNKYIVGCAKSCSDALGEILEIGRASCRERV